MNNIPPGYSCQCGNVYWDCDCTEEYDYPHRDPDGYETDVDDYEELF